MGACQGFERCSVRVCIRVRGYPFFSTSQGFFGFVSRVNGVFYHFSLIPGVFGLRLGLGVRV